MNNRVIVKRVQEMNVRHCLQENKYERLQGKERNDCPKNERKKSDC